MTTHRPCPAALIVNGEHHPCDWPTDQDGRHEGSAHTNQAAGARWQGVPVGDITAGVIRAALAIADEGYERAKAAGR